MQRRSMTQRTRNMFTSSVMGPVLKTKVQNITVPPPMKSSLAAKQMDASFFVVTWDLRGKSLSEVKNHTNLLPRGFDIYVIGLQNCASLTEVTEICQDVLQEFGNYKEFSYLMSGEGRRKTSLALLVLARDSLASEGNLSMNRVDCVRDRRLSALRYLNTSDSVTLSTADNQKTLDRLDLNGGAVFMRFSYFDTHFQLICVKMSCIGELNEILARVEPEKHPHVVMFGDFGEDVMENTEELNQRLYLEEFNPIPGQFQNSRAIVVTKSRNRILKKYLKTNLHGHYDLLPKQVPAAFTTFRLHGGAGGHLAAPPSTASSRWTGNMSFMEVPPPPSLDLRESWIPPPPSDLRFSMMSSISAIPPPPPSEYSRLSTGSFAGSVPPPPDSRRGSLASTFSAVLPPPPSEEVEEEEEEELASEQKRKSSRSSLRESLRSLASMVMEEKRNSGFLSRKASSNGTNSGSLEEEFANGNLCADSLRRALQSVTGALGSGPGWTTSHAFGTCKECKKEIWQEEDSFQVVDDKYHKDCIRCSDCGDLITSQVFTVNNKILCQKSYEKLFDQRCAVCGDPANKRDHLIKTSSHTIHLDCFKCSTCDKPLAELDETNSKILSSDFVRDENGSFFCAQHGAKHSCVRCREKVPVSDAVQVCMGEPGDNAIFHLECFVCETCERPIHELGGQYYLHEDKIYCSTDYNKLLDLFCGCCGEPLVHGEVYIMNFDKKFHKTCYKCSTCGDTDLNVPYFENSVLSCASCHIKSKK